MPIRKRRAARPRQPVNSRRRIEHNPAFPIHAPHKIVQRIYRRQARKPIRVRRRRTAAKRQRRLMLREIVRYIPYLVSRNARNPRHLLRRIRPQIHPRRQRRRRARVRQPVRDNHLRYAQRKHTLCPRLDIHPLIRVCRRQRKPRIDMYQLAALAALRHIPERAIPAPIPHRRYPSVKPVPPKRQDSGGVCDVKIRQRVLPEHPPCRRPQRGLLQRLVSHPPRPILRREPIRHQPHMRPHRIRRQHNRALTPGLAYLPQLMRQPRYRVLPAYLTKLIRAALAHANHRPPNPIRVIQRLQAALAARAVRPLVDGIIHIPLNLLSAPLHHPHHYPLPRGTLPAHRRIPVIAPRNQILRHLYRRLHKQLILRHAARLKEYRAGSRAAG